MKKIVLKFKDKNLVLNLRDTPTADMIYEALPFTSTVKKWGEEIYFETPVDVKLEDVINVSNHVESSVLKLILICSDDGSQLFSRLSL